MKGSESKLERPATMRRTILYYGHISTADNALVSGTLLIHLLEKRPIKWTPTYKRHHFIRYLSHLLITVGTLPL